MDTTKPPDPHHHYYRAYRLDTDETEAAAQFAAHYGQPPQWIFEELGNLLAGPIPAQAVPA